MVNQQILDYVRQQLAAGTTKQVIAQSLATGGWSAVDIAQAFDAIEGAHVAPAAPTVPLSAPHAQTVQPMPISTAKSLTYPTKNSKIYYGSLIYLILLIPAYILLNIVLVKLPHDFQIFNSRFTEFFIHGLIELLSYLPVGGILAVFLLIISTPTLSRAVYVWKIILGVISLLAITPIVLIVLLPNGIGGLFAYILLPMIMLVAVPVLIIGILGLLIAGSRARKNILRHSA